MGRATYKISYQEPVADTSVSITWDTASNGDRSSPFELGGDPVYFKVQSSGDYQLWVTAGRARRVSTGTSESRGEEIVFAHEDEKQLGATPEDTPTLSWVRNAVERAAIESVEDGILKMTGYATGLANISYGTGGGDRWELTLPQEGTGTEKVAIIARSYEGTGADRVWGGSASLVFEVREPIEVEPAFDNIAILCRDTALAPLSGTTVIITLSGGGIMTAQSNADGWAFFDQVPYGTHDIKFTHPRVTDSDQDDLANDTITVGPTAPTAPEFEGDGE